MTEAKLCDCQMRRKKTKEKPGYHLTSAAAAAAALGLKIFT